METCIVSTYAKHMTVERLSNDVCRICRDEEYKETALHLLDTYPPLCLWMKRLLGAKALTSKIYVSCHVLLWADFFASLESLICFNGRWAIFLWYHNGDERRRLWPITYTLSCSHLLSGQFRQTQFLLC